MTATSWWSAAKRAIALAIIVESLVMLKKCIVSLYFAQSLVYFRVPNVYHICAHMRATCKVGTYLLPN